MKRFHIGLLTILLSLPAFAIAQEPNKEAAPSEKSDEGSDDKKDKKKEEKIKPYEEIITDEAESQDGLFQVHKVDDKYYYEIPPAELGKELLLVVTMARAAPGVSYGGQTLASQVIRWEKNGDQILLRSQKYDAVASPGSAIAQAVAVSNNPTILMTFPVKAYASDGAPVIEVGELFTTEITEFSARRALGAKGFDKKRSLVERISAYPTNVEAEASHTFTVPPPSGDRPSAPSRRRGMRPGSGTVLVHYSMVDLPDTPMMPRRYDERVGYFRVRQYDYSSDEHRAYQKAYITRWRLEKKNPSAKLSEPVKPIVYYVDPATPTKWVPYVKRGIEAWQSAFEEAGFKNAIIAKDAPSKEEDPNWSPEDARYSVVRWVSSTIENAMGPHVNDPRTGEIIESDIKMWHNVMNLLRHWYFVQVAPLDKKARRLPFPDELMGRLIEHVTTHEVGHTLGLPHNMKASSQYPLEKVRDKNWVKKMGHTPTLMDYSRFNYVAQPEDGIDPIDLIPRVGPYDRFAIMWGYKPVKGAKTPEDELKALGKWIVDAQEKTPWLRFSTAKSRGSDPGELTEAVGDADAVKATELGMKNLNRVMDLLLEAVPQEGKSFDDLEEVYGRVLGQWVREMGHVAALVGGFWSRQKHAGQEGLLFEPVARAKQAEAVEFLNVNAFATPTMLIRKEVSRRIEPQGVVDRITSSQTRVLRSLMSPSRIERLVEQEALDGAAAYRAIEFLADLRKGLFSEAYDSAATNAFRRNLQRAYVELLDGRLNGRAPVTDDQRPLFRGELDEIRAVLTSATGADAITKLHFEDLVNRINQALDPKFQRASDGSGSGSGQRGIEENIDTCWPDLLIQGRISQ